MPDIYESQFKACFSYWVVEFSTSPRACMVLSGMAQEVVATEFLEHVGHVHGASGSFVEEVSDLLSLWATRKAERKERVGLDGESLSLCNLLPKELAALP